MQSKARAEGAASMRNKFAEPTLLRQPPRFKFGRLFGFTRRTCGLICLLDELKLRAIGTDVAIVMSLPRPSVCARTSYFAYTTSNQPLPQESNGV